MDETVRYEYDAGGNRTQMTLPGSKTIAYSYDEVGRLIGLTAWDDQHSDFHYDKAGRHVGTQRPNGLSSDYAYNPAGHLRRVRHRAGSSLRGQFNYTVDGRGNRTRAFEHMATATTVTNTLTKTDTAVTFTRGTWTDDGAYKKTTQFSGRMQITYTGDEALLTIGTGPDHGMIDISINGRYWRRFNTYTAQPGEQVLHIPEVTTPPGATSGVIEIRNRSDRHHRSTGHVFRFKQLAVIDTTYADTTIDYTYDALSRLQQANYNTGQRIYDYNFDLAGNRIQEALSGTGVTAKTTNYTYNATNQMTNDGTHTLTYDANGNLTSDGTNTYTWDRANRLTQIGNTSYTYDGLGNRVSQTVGTTATNYLLDLQPGLTKVLAATTGTNTDHYIHAPRGIHSMENTSGDWTYAVQDGLGSVRSLIDSTLGVDAVQSYNPYGVPDSNYGAGFGFTGEQTDANGQVYLRARYYNPSIGVFNSLDPFEGLSSRPMSLNGYAYVEGNVENRVDPSGYFASEDEIRSGDIEYSCHCGWLDWSHIGQGDPAFDILSNMELAANYSGSDSPYATPDPQRYWGFRKRGQIGAAVPVIDYLIVTLFDDIAVVPGRELLSSDDRIALAVSILMSSDELFEQAQLDSPLGILRPTLRDSAFSEEDLPSNLIGMYIGIQRYLNPGVGLQQLKPQIRRACGGFGIQGSIDVYHNTYGNGDSLVSGWQTWYPRYLLLLTCNGAIDLDRNNQRGICNRQTRVFPTMLTDLSAMRVQPQVGGRWWWQGMEYSQSGNNQLRTETSREISDDLYEVFVYTLSYPEPPPSPTPVSP